MPAINRAGYFAFTAAPLDSRWGWCMYRPAGRARSGWLRLSIPNNAAYNYWGFMQGKNLVLKRSDNSAAGNPLSWIQ